MRGTIVMPRRRRFTSDGRPICDYCGIENHIEFKCQQKRRDQQQATVLPMPTSPTPRKVEYEEYTGFMGTIFPSSPFPGKKIETHGHLQEKKVVESFCVKTESDSEKRSEIRCFLKPVRMMPSSFIALMTFILLVGSNMAVAANPIFDPSSHRQRTRSHLLLSLPGPQPCFQLKAQTKSASYLQFDSWQDLTELSHCYLLCKSDQGATARDEKSMHDNSLQNIVNSSHDIVSSATGQQLNHIANRKLAQLIVCESSCNLLGPSDNLCSKTSTAGGPVILVQSYLILEVERIANHAQSPYSVHIAISFMFQRTAMLSIPEDTKALAAI